MFARIAAGDADIDTAIKDAPPLHDDFRHWMKTSLTVLLTTTLFSLIIDTLAAYSLVRFKFPGARSMGMFITYLVPPILLLFPMMNLTARIELPLPEFTFALRPLKRGLSFETRRLYNSLWALILVYPTMLVPFSTWLG